MTMTIVKTEDHELQPLNGSGTINDAITKKCESCSQPFLVKYWDAELDWYIEINATSRCRKCQGS